MQKLEKIPKMFVIFFLKTKGKKRGYSEKDIIDENELPRGFEIGLIGEDDDEEELTS